MKKSGQALVEFVVSIVAVIVLVAGLVQIGLLTKVHTDVMQEAREKAGELVLSPMPMGMAPDYIGKWEDGPDGVNYSSDDEAAGGNLAGFQGMTIAGAQPRRLYDQVGDNEFYRLIGDPLLVMNGFVKGSSTRTVELLPAMRSLLYGTDSTDVKCDVWMVNGGGLY